MTPTQRSLAMLRDGGYLPAVVEHWNAYARIRQDLYGCIDIVAIHPLKPGVLAIQTTTKSNMAARLEKIKTVPAVKIWLAAQNSFKIHGWYKKEGRWFCSIWAIDDHCDFGMWPKKTGGF
jgi:hypothetical protein